MGCDGRVAPTLWDPTAYLHMGEYAHGKILTLRVTSGGYLFITCTVLDQGCDAKSHNLHMHRELCMAFKIERTALWS